MQPTLLILAAGMGSRYGSLKQIDRFGPSGETIVEYSIYDALRAGFGRVVLVVRRGFADDFREVVLKRIPDHVPVDFVYQELENLPGGFSVPEGRQKPWGTGHAVLMAEGTVKEPFAVINADDFYGAESYRIMHGFLKDAAGQSFPEFCLVDYNLGNTLSESGTVSRGVCHVDNSGYLVDITEHRKIRLSGTEIVSESGEGSPIIFSGNERVSMNLMGFTPPMFDFLREQFTGFLQENLTNLTAEFFLPFALNEAISKGKARVRVLPTPEKWFGVTYREDRNMVVSSLNALVDTCIYPVDLWA